MGWLPLGQRVHILSSLPVDSVRIALRNAMGKGLRDPEALIGFVIGPILYVQAGWFGSPPAFLARLKRNPTGVEIIGNAGLNIAGIIVFGCVTALAMLIGGITFLLRGDPEWLVFSFAVLAMMYGIGWFNHIYRKDADPLLHIVRRAVRANELEVEDRAFDRTPVSSATMIVDGETREGAPSEYDVREALLELSEYQFVIISFDDQVYMQSLKENGAYRLEVRRGSDQRHYEATNLDANRVVRVMTAYLNDQKSSHGIVWKQVHP